MSVAISVGPMSSPVDLDTRARQSLGASHDAIYAMVAAAITRHGAAGGAVLDVGCGSGGLLRVAGSLLASYRGLDAVRYDALPAGVAFTQIDLDRPEWPVADSSADVVAAVETIEHLENPWAFMRQLARLVRPGGLVAVTTPNQLSALSLITLAAKRRFSSFQDVHYPAHRTALLECDLRRATGAAGLEVLEAVYSGVGRLPLSAWHYPAWLAQGFPRLLSDNLMIVARRPRA